MKRKWLKALLLVSIACLPILPRDVEELVRVMNETKIEFSIPDDSDKGDGNRWWLEIDRAQPVDPDVLESEDPSVD